MTIRGVDDEALPIFLQRLPRLRKLTLFVTIEYPADVASKKARKLKRAQEQYGWLKRYRQAQLARSGKLNNNPKTESSSSTSDTKKDNEEEVGAELEEEEMKEDDVGSSKGWLDEFCAADLTSLALTKSNITGYQLAELLARRFPSHTGVTIDFVDRDDTGFSNLHLTNCKNIGDNALEAIAEYLGHTIRNLSFFACKKVKDAGLMHLIGCTRLEGLDVRGCDISDVGVRHVARNCAHLRSVQLPPRINVASRQKLRQEFRRINFTLSSQEWAG